MPTISKLGFATAVALLACVVITLLAGVPAKLPAVALGSDALLHVERAIALFVGYLAIAVVLVRSWEGQLPDEISGRGLKYAARELKIETREAIAGLRDHAAVTSEEIAALRSDLASERAERSKLERRVEQSRGPSE